MPDPIIPASERVESPPPAGAALPAELQGKSSEDIVKHYQERERLAKAAHDQDLRRQVEAARKANPAPAPEPVKVDRNKEFWADPVKVTQQIADEAASKASSGNVNQETLERVARRECKEKHPDFDSLSREIEEVMEMMTPTQRTQITMWEVAYFQIKGMKADMLIERARAEGSKGGGAEFPSPTPIAPSGPRKLGDSEQNVASRLGITPERYVEAESQVASGAWPQTLDNTKKGAKK